MLKSTLPFIRDVANVFDVTDKYAKIFGHVPIISTQLPDGKLHTLESELHVNMRIYIATIRVIVIDKISKELSNDGKIISYVRYMHKKMDIQEFEDSNIVISMGVLVDLIDETFPDDLYSSTLEMVKYLMDILPSRLIDIITDVHMNISNMMQYGKYHNEISRVFLLHQFGKAEIDAMHVGIMTAYVHSVKDFIPVTNMYKNSNENEYEKDIGVYIFTMLKCRRETDMLPMESFKLSSKELSTRLDPHNIFQHIPGVLSGIINPYVFYLLELKFIEISMDSQIVHKLSLDRLERNCRKLVDRHFNKLCA